MTIFGPVKRWKDGDVLWAENDILLMAYVVTDDFAKVGTIGLHDNRIYVEFINADQAKAWDTL